MNTIRPTLAVLASGRGSNCRALLEAARSGRLPAHIRVVLSDREDAPVLAMAESLGATARYLDPGRKGARLTPEAEARYVAVLREHQVEWVALAGFMRILGAPLLDAYANHIVNIHPSLLPSFPGLAGPRQAHEAGVKVAGCTVHFVDAGVDTGPIIAQRALSVGDHDDVDALTQRILDLEHETYIDALTWAVTGQLHVQGRRVLRTAAPVQGEPTP